MDPLPKRQQSQYYGIASILLASLLWGTTGTSAAFLTGVSPITIGAFSTAIGGVLLASFAYKNIYHDRHLLKEAHTYVLAGAAALVVYALSFYTAMSLSGVAIGSVISLASAPFFSVLLERLINKENNLSLAWLISFFLGIIGMALMMSSDNHLPQEQANNLNKYMGALLGGIAGMAYAIYALMAKNIINQGAHSKSAIGSVFGVGALFFAPIIFLHHDNLFATTQNIIISSYMAVIPMFIGYVLFGYGLKTVHVSKATLLTLFEPIMATVFAVTIVKEAFTLEGYIGIVLIIICLVIQSYK